MRLPAASYGESQQRIFLIITLQAAGYLPKERIKNNLNQKKEGMVQKIDHIWIGWTLFKIVFIDNVAIYRFRTTGY